MKTKHLDFRISITVHGTGVGSVPQDLQFNVVRPLVQILFCACYSILILLFVVFFLF